jgi:hypothetical protein
MSEFTNEDREKLTKTYTILEGHVKTSDERHQDYLKKIEDHENRIRANEGIVAKVAICFSFIGAVCIAGITTLWKKIIS